MILDRQLGHVYGLLFFLQSFFHLSRQYYMKIKRQHKNIPIWNEIIDVPYLIYNHKSYLPDNIRVHNSMTWAES